ncbi:MAG: hypothetical protein DRP55_04330 [Spirochaetes bacterium]|nr:MAG: hypothetical protein DRP55_04330 [Spirochaetota bacterium]
MRKEMFCCILAAFLAYPVMAMDVENKETCNVDFTHTVFVEYTTATWCPYCKYAHVALKDVYDGGEYPFYYVSLIIDKNSRAYSRAVDDYNIYYIPTVFFDGGYSVYVGADTSTADIYRNLIEESGARGVASVTPSISATWMGNSSIKIDVVVESGEVLPYDGYVRVYVAEIVSSLGWKDTGGEPYTFAFLDFAVNEQIHIEGMQTWNKTVVWDGGEFGELSPENIMVMAVIFNGEKHQGYTVPPDGSPFDAYYVDNAVASVPSMDETPPQVEITAPKGGYLYLFRKEIMNIGKTMVIGKVDIAVQAIDDATGVAKVSFYVDGEAKSVVSSPPYQWTWDEFAIGNHEIRTVATDMVGNEGSNSMELLIIIL